MYPVQFLSSLSLSPHRKIETSEKQITHHTKTKTTQKPNTHDYKTPIPSLHSCLHQQLVTEALNTRESSEGTPLMHYFYFTFFVFGYLLITTTISLRREQNMKRTSFSPLLPKPRAYVRASHTYIFRLPTTTLSRG